MSVPQPSAGTEAGTQAVIVVGVDGSAPSVQALRWAGRLAPTLGASIAAVAAWEFPAESAFGAYPPVDWNPEQDAAAALDEAVTEAFGEAVPDGLQRRVLRGQAARVLLEESRPAAMLIVGSRGHGGFAGLLLGSVSSACAEHAGCPVLVVHESGAPGREAEGAAS
ncbi:universal stress protein [Paenarthrobacter sp. DKR-5]|uniref:universal stress protein n=1 Tax=Paenarthrobacter sp. DKR-5 TaxID=2835535 RepID=UPI001BDC5E0C|nr:universal stress protein [Paenarthrobacter sp. DKR-5]MBT1003785.1 universal stress protein [Paenarthrobacter sp. DKR-5]